MDTLVDYIVLLLIVAVIVGAVIYLMNKFFADLGARSDKHKENLDALDIHPENE